MWSLVVILSGLLTSAVAQTGPVDSQSDAGGTGQNSSELLQAQTGSGATPAQPRGPIHIVPFGRGDAGPKNGAAPAGAHLTYFGGPVISNIHVVAVFWGPTVNSAVTGGIGQFFTDITSSNYYDLLSEYSTVGITSSGGVSSNQSLVRGQFDGANTITPSIPCPGGTCTITDSQIQTELTAQINAGHLPQPLSDLQGIIKTFYMIYFPPGVTIDAGGGALSCVVFCAYHSNTNNASPSLRMPYGVLPDFAPPSACSRSCGQGSLFQNVTAVTSHEMAEAATDAQVGSSTVNNGPPLAWYDPSPPPTPDLGEIGDICNGQDTLVSAGGNTYSVQQEFSNLQNDCVSRPPVFDISIPAAVAPGSAFNVTLTVRTTAGNFTTPIPGYTGTVHFTSSDATAILPGDYTFTATDAGAHIFSVTLSTQGDQTITLTDVRSSGFNGSTTTNVNTQPDMVISKSHPGDFFFGRTGTYTIVISNNGQGPTTSAVSMTDTLPTGMSVNALSGTGWSCNSQTVTCTRSDVLPRGASYPAITLVVNVAANAPTPVLNTAVVSGGGETNTANDITRDPTNIVTPPLPDLTIVKSHSGPRNGDFFQGETGATYSITVTNIGSASTSGTVSVVDTPPAGQLIPTALSGAGWSCNLGTLTCTRNDALAAGASYPVITLTVNVALDAPPILTNTATVSGGGETNTSNDAFGDLTSIQPPPGADMTIAQSHIGRFLLGRTGDYTIVASNVGTAASIGTVAVSYSLPSGLTTAAMSGSGWNCNVATISCTRTDALGAGGSYPVITLTVKVDPNATSPVSGTVTISGGGDVNAGNNSATDFTEIVAPVVDLFTQVFSTTNFFQGQTGGNVSVFITNVGTIPSSGPVTVVVSFASGMTATAISGTGWICTLSNLTCTRSDSLNTGPGYPNIVLSVNVAANAPPQLPVTATLTGGGDGSPANNTATLNFPVTPAVQLTGLGLTTGTVSAGQSSAFNFQIVTTSSAGVVTFTCSGLPAGAACNFSPSSLPPVSAITAVTMNVSTTARSEVIGTKLRMPGNKIFLWQIFLLLGLLTFALALLRKPRMKFKPAFGVAGVVLLLILAGCGGGGSSFNPSPTPTPQNPNGTPVGTYAITVSATGSSAGSATQVFTLNVK